MATLISGSTGVDKIQDGTITNADINASAAIAGSKLSGGSPPIIGVQQQWVRGTQSIGTSEIDVTDGSSAMVVTSTNTSATKFLVKAMAYVGANSDVGCYFFLYRSIDGGTYTKLTNAHSAYGGGGSSSTTFMTACAGDNDSWSWYTGSHISNEYLDTPSFSTSVSYKIRAKGYSGTHYLGRMANHNNSSSWSHSAPSCITLMELA